jgi:translation initiation factor IF-3
MIRVPQVRVVDEEGGQLGVMPTAEALGLAQEKGLDLVEVAPMASPPVTRLLDYGQFKYEQTRREKEARRHQRAVEFKEVRLTPKIGKGDFETKVRRAIQFLGAGGRVKVTVRFRGRELTHAHLGREMLFRFADLIKDHGAIERQPLLEGKSMSIVVASTHKPKPQAAPAEAPAADGRAQTAAPVPAAAPAEARAEVPPKAPAAPAEEPEAPTAAPAAKTEAVPADGPARAAKPPAPAAKAPATEARTGAPAAGRTAATKPKPSPARSGTQRQAAASRPGGE